MVQSWGKQWEWKRKWKEHKGARSTSFYSWLGAYFLCKLDFSCCCMCAGSPFEPFSRKRVEGQVDWAWVSRWSRMLIQNRSAPPPQDTLFQSYLSSHNSQNVWDKTCLCLVLHRGWKDHRTWGEKRLSMAQNSWACLKTPEISQERHLLYFIILSHSRNPRGASQIWQKMLIRCSQAH